MTTEQLAQHLRTLVGYALSIECRAPVGAVGWKRDEAGERTYGAGPQLVIGVSVLGGSVWADFVEGTSIEVVQNGLSIVVHEPDEHDSRFFADVYPRYYPNLPLNDRLRAILTQYGAGAPA